MARVFVIAHSPALRAGLRAMLAMSVSIELIGEATRLDDLGMPLAAFNGADVLVFASSEDLPPVSYGKLSGQALVVLADRADRDELHSMVQMRRLAPHAWGILPPDASADALHAVVSAVAQGLTVLSNSLAEQLLPTLMSAQTSPTAAEIDLTPREREVLDGLGRGLPNKLIAQELGITEATVKFHASAVYVKLGAASRSEAISKAARMGLITL